MREIVDQQPGRARDPKAWQTIDNELPSREAADRIVKIRKHGNSVVRPSPLFETLELRTVESDVPGLWAIEARPEVRQPSVVLDDGDMVGALYAEFDDAAYVRFGQDRKGNLRLQSIHASEAFRGRDMIDWLVTTYGRSIVVNEVTVEAAGFWEIMQSEGRIAQWSERRFTGATVPVTTRASSDSRMESAQKATSFLEELPRKVAPHV